jgi:hypothetical protein
VVGWVGSDYQAGGIEEIENNIAVPYNPEMEKGVSPNPTGSVDPKNMASVTNTPIEKLKAHSVILLVS